MKIIIRWVLFVSCIALCFVGCANASYFEAQEDTAMEADVPEKKDGSSDADGTSEKEDEPPEVVYVQVAGAVNQPGVFKLTPESRVFEAIDAAGGLAPEADDADLNQAEGVTDGQKIYVYAIGEKAAEPMSGEASEDDGRVNINTATESELMTLSGIGQAKAAAIIKYRESHGGFSSTDDIMQVEGIKEGTFHKIEDSIKI